MHLAIYRNQNPPTDSAEEPSFLVVKKLVFGLKRSGIDHEFLHSFFCFAYHLLFNSILPIWLDNFSVFSRVRAQCHPGSFLGILLISSGATNDALAALVNKFTLPFSP